MKKMEQYLLITSIELKQILASILSTLKEKESVNIFQIESQFDKRLIKQLNPLQEETNIPYLFLLLFINRLS